MQKVINIFDYILNKIIAFIIIIALLYSCWSLYDIFLIYNNASAHTIFNSSNNSYTLEELMEHNDRVCARISIIDTGIDFPVVQGTDNLEYVNKNYNGEDSISGSIFIDASNDRNFKDFYTLFYGHRMEASAMFGDIPNFLEKEYFESHPTGCLELPDGKHTIYFFACSKTLANNKYLFNVLNANRNKEILIDEIKHTSIQSRGIQIEENDRIIALSTCESATTSGRIILFGILKGE